MALGVASCEAVRERSVRDMRGVRAGGFALTAAGSQTRGPGQEAMRGSRRAASGIQGMLVCPRNMTSVSAALRCKDPAASMRAALTYGCHPWRPDGAWGCDPTTRRGTPSH